MHQPLPALLAAELIRTSGSWIHNMPASRRHADHSYSSRGGENNGTLTQHRHALSSHPGAHTNKTSPQSPAASTSSSARTQRRACSQSHTSSCPLPSASTSPSAQGGGERGGTGHRFERNRGPLHHMCEWSSHPFGDTDTSNPATTAALQQKRRAFVIINLALMPRVLIPA